MGEIEIERIPTRLHRWRWSVVFATFEHPSGDSRCLISGSTMTKWGAKRAARKAAGGVA